MRVWKSARRLRRRRPPSVRPGAPVYPGVLDELVASARHRGEQYANNHIATTNSESIRTLVTARRAFAELAAAI